MRFLRTALLTLAFAFIALPAYTATILYTATLDGASESPSNASPGTGAASVTLDTLANTLHVAVSFSDLLGTTTAAHIHAATTAPGVGTAGVATTTPSFAGFPLGVTSGSYDTLLDLTDSSSYNPAFIAANGATVAGAEAALVAALAAGTAYFNIHTTFAPGGEIRGFLQAASAPIPEPTTLFLLGSGLVGLAGYGRKRKK